MASTTAAPPTSSGIILHIEQNYSCFLYRSNVPGRMLMLSLQAAILITLVWLIRPIFRRLRMPQTMAEVFGGIIMGPTFFGSIGWVKAELFPDTSIGVLRMFSITGRQLFCFLVGLELDPALIMRAKGRASVIALSAIIASGSVGALATGYLHPLVSPNATPGQFRAIVALFMANGGSTVLHRLATELKLGTSEVGQLALSATVFTDVLCLSTLFFVTSESMIDGRIGDTITGALIGVLIMLVLLFVVGPSMVLWAKEGEPERAHITDYHLCIIICLAIASGAFGETLGYDGMVSAFLFGLLFPRQRRIALTVADRLYYPVRLAILPTYLGFIGHFSDLRLACDRRGMEAVVVMVVTAIVSKLIAVVVAALAYKIPLHEGLVLGFFLNTRGVADVVLFSACSNRGMLNLRSHAIFITAAVTISGLTGPAVVLIMQQVRRRMPAYLHPGMERQSPNALLHILSCIYGPADVPVTLNLVEACRVAQPEIAPLSVSAVHLIEFTERSASPLMYRRDNSATFVSYEAEAISEVLRAYRLSNGIPIRLIAAVSYYFNMHEDICTTATNMRTSLIILPFHKFQRVDGKMYIRNHALQKVNQRTQDHAPCSVGILVNRGLGGATVKTATNVRMSVAALFFGGPDDREAMAFGMRMALNPSINFTIMRFLPCNKYDKEIDIEDEDESGYDVEMELDDAFMSECCKRYVKSKTVAYEERSPHTCEEIVMTLREIALSYSLFIVGRGGPGAARLTAGLIGWEDCPELGPVGDLLSSSEFSITCSVLIIKQARPLSSAIRVSSRGRLGG
ncbi:cation/H(+) antiporter 19-like [Amborella trichopoda]|nr:cation/H(+) antiporter 19-like [Amborella trichopoda]|eukprot:XP_011622843.2 cation/H(+) antiporter 19-like [Amborella trichopoda]